MNSSFFKKDENWNNFDNTSNNFVQMLKPQ